VRMSKIQILKVLSRLIFCILGIVQIGFAHAMAENPDSILPKKPKFGFIHKDANTLCDVFDLKHYLSRERGVIDGSMYSSWKPEQVQLWIEYYRAHAIEIYKQFEKAGFKLNGPHSCEKEDIHIPLGWPYNALGAIFSIRFEYTDNLTKVCLSASHSGSKSAKNNLPVQFIENGIMMDWPFEYKQRQTGQDYYSFAVPCFDRLGNINDFKFIHN